MNPLQLTQYYSQLVAYFHKTPNSLFGPLELPIAITLGLILGSYLNVVIYRLSAAYQPVNYKGKLSVSEPKGSFCPLCLHKLRWYENIPLLAYLFLKGKCGHCKTSISLQYPSVEALTATLLTTWWATSQTLEALLIGSLLLVFIIPCAIIDIKTRKIPNTLTLWGTLTILLASTLTENPINSIVGATLATLGTFFFVQLGKALFGTKKISFPKRKKILWEAGENPTFTLEEDGKSLEESEKMTIPDIFHRNSDFLGLEGELLVTSNNQSITCKKITLSPKKIEITGVVIMEKDENTLSLQTISITGETKTITLPQEALGMGDVKLMALIGAALGAESALHTITLAAILGSLFAFSLRIAAKIKKQNPPPSIAFGPWICIAAIIILFYKK